MLLYYAFVYPCWKCKNRRKFVYLDANRTSRIVKHAEKEEGAVRFVCISDTHTRHWSLSVPPGDVLLLCGDLTISDKGPYLADINRLRDLNRWLGTLPHQHKLVIAGNHDRAIQEMGQEAAKQLFTNATYLENEEITVFGIRIYASPISCGGSRNHAFQYDSAEIKEFVSRIPEGIDILMTHGPPARFGPGYWGCPILRARVGTVCPRYHVFGHDHDTYGVYPAEDSPTIFINAALAVSFIYNLSRFPIVFDIRPNCSV
jgi:predicted phosphohydrolase